MKTTAVSRLHVREVGTDVPVVLLHHGLGSSEVYTLEQPAGVAQWIAARGCRVLAPDLPGHGFSDSVTEFADDFVERVAADLAGMLDARGIRRAGAVVGVGLGGLVALRFAAEFPGRVSSVVADSPPGLLDGDAAGTGWEPWPLQGLGQITRPDMAQHAAWGRFVDRQRARDPYAELEGALSCPALMLFGGEAGSPAAARVYEVARGLPAEVALLPAEAPPCCWHAPSYFMREVESFLAAHA